MSAPAPQLPRSLSVSPSTGSGASVSVQHRSTLGHRPAVSAGQRGRVAALTLAAIATYAVVLAKGLVRCPLAATFHVPCPTCGATRSTLALLHGDLHGTLLNPVAPLLVVLLGGFAARLVYVAARDGHTRAFDEPPAVRAMLKVFVVALLVALILWILRFFGWFGGPVPV